MFKLAHLSDIHLSPMPRARPGELFNKRVLGYINWHRGRKLVHRRDVLDALTRDLTERSPDHIAVTGDLVNLGLAQEFARARDWLRSLDEPDRVTAIPGNHDAYIRMSPEKSTAHWHPYMLANAEGERAFPAPASGFPFVRCFGDIAIVALSSAIPTLPFIAAGALGSAQRAKLAEALDSLGKAGMFRIVLIHHPPLPGQCSWRRGLRDSRELAAILQAHGAELILHGHNHERSLRRLDTATGEAFVIGVPSASEARAGSDTPEAAYNEYRIDRVEDGWRCEMTTRAPRGTPDNIWQSDQKILRER